MRRWGWIKAGLLWALWLVSEGVWASDLDDLRAGLSETRALIARLRGAEVAEDRRHLLRDVIVAASDQALVRADVVATMMKIESDFRADVYSCARAYGLMQLMPATAAAMGVNRYEVVDNVVGGARYLRHLLERYRPASLELLAAAYNAGPDVLALPYARWPGETQVYVRRFRETYRLYEGDGWRHRIPLHPRLGGERRSRDC